MMHQIQFIDQLKVGQAVKVKKPHMTIVMGSNEVPFLQLPRIELPKGIHGKVSFTKYTGEFHVKWVELEVETIEHFDSSVFETLEFEE